jgi:hypothetical protein
MFGLISNNGYVRIADARIADVRMKVKDIGYRHASIQTVICVKTKIINTYPVRMEKNIFAQIVSLGLRYI